MCHFAGSFSLLCMYHTILSHNIIKEKDSDNHVSMFILGSLKSSSRRRPVSVDYELNSNSWENELDSPVATIDNDFQVGGASAGGGRVLKDTTNNRSSHYSNRNSHPLTEREMEQGLQNIEGHKGKTQKG